MIDLPAESLNIYLVILIHGSLIFLSFLFFSNAFKVNSKANVFFGIFLFLWSSYWIEEIYVLTQLSKLGDSGEMILRFSQFFTPAFFYLGTIHYTNPQFSFTRRSFAYLLIPILYLICLIYSMTESAIEHIETLLTIAIFIHSFYFIYKSYYVIQLHKKRLGLFSSSTKEKDLKWIEYIIISLIALLVFFSVYNILFVTTYLNIFANFFSLIIVLFIAFNGVRQKEIFILDATQRNEIIKSTESTTSNKRNPLSDEDLNKLKAIMTTVMASKEPFLKPDLSLLQLSDILCISPHQLSYLINEGFGENFFSFINKYRVEKVISTLNKQNLKKYSILGIAYQSGFNSKTTFYKTFKKITSLTPSEYIKRSSYL